MQEKTIQNILSRKPFAIIGHRGARGLAQENTAEAIEEAIKHRADIVEIDVQSTADKVLVASHDPTITLDNKHIDIRRTNYTDILSSIKDPRYLPKIEDLLEEYIDKIAFFLEIKNPQDTKKLLQLVAEKNYLNRVAIISFYEEALVEVRKLHRTITTGIIYYRPPGRILECKKIKCNIVLPRYPLATEKAIKFAHKLGLRVVAWTVNDGKTMEELARRGVDGIATDRPDIARAVREKLVATS